MTNPTIVGTPTGIGLSNGADQVHTLPAGRALGDVIVLIGGHFERAGQPPGPVGADFTWTEVFFDSTTTHDWGAWVAEIDTLTPTTVTNNGSGDAADGCASCVMVWNGVDVADIVDVISSIVDTRVPPAINTTVDDCIAIIITRITAPDSAIAAGTPAGYTLATELAFRNDTNDITFAIGYKALGAAGTETPGEWTALTPTNPRSITFAIKPPAGIPPQEATLPKIPLSLTLNTVTREPGTATQPLPMISLNLTPQALDREPGSAERTLSQVDLTLLLRPFDVSIPALEATLPRILLDLTPNALTTEPGSMDRNLPQIDLTLNPTGLTATPGVVERLLPQIGLDLTPLAFGEPVPGTAEAPLPQIGIQLLLRPFDRVGGAEVRALPRIILTLDPQGLSIEPGEVTVGLPQIPLNLLGRDLEREPGVANRDLPRIGLDLAPRTLLRSPGGVVRELRIVTLELVLRALEAGGFEVPRIDNAVVRLQAKNARGTIYVGSVRVGIQTHHIRATIKSEGSEGGIQ